MNWKRVQPELRRRIQWVQAYAKYAGVRSTVTSGYRTYAQQKRLYEHPEGYPVSPPGCTSHELGLAVDLVADTGGRSASGEPTPEQAYLMDLGRYAGLTTYMQDPIHFTLYTPQQIRFIQEKFCNRQ